MKILHLTLNKKWFDRHLEDKKEDYREIKPYWIVRLFEWSNRPGPAYSRISIWQAKQLLPELTQGYIRPNIRPIKYDCVEAKNGYSSTDPAFRKEYKTVEIGIGNPDWGAPSEPVFIIKLGEILETKNINPSHSKNRAKSRITMSKKITILRRKYINLSGDLTEEVSISGELFEHAGFQFCLCRIEDMLHAIELATGFSAAYSHVRTACFKKQVIDKITHRGADEYKEAVKSVIKQGFSVPLNEPIKTNQS